MKYRNDHFLQEAGLHVVKEKNHNKINIIFINDRQNNRCIGHTTDSVVSLFMQREILLPPFIPSCRGNILFFKKQVQFLYQHGFKW